MASSSIYGGVENNLLSNIEDEVQHAISDRDILECEGVPQHLWTTKCVSLHNENGDAVGEGIFHSVKSDLAIRNNRPFSDTHVAVQISKSLKVDEFPDNWRYSVRAWPITHVFYNGANLFNHERQHKFNTCGLSQGLECARHRRRVPNKLLQNVVPELSRRTTTLLLEESINLVSSKVCYKRNCVQPFSRLKIQLLREQMYCQTEFDFKNHLKLDVHRQIHANAEGCRVVTLEGEEVCLAAWRHIMEVPETTFYRYTGYAAEGRSA
jgi:hypothetical protein